ncbi:hypothetical protein LZ554_005564 [Drepanopeziza brunnea f. sp. 'monogermtubi']|nr:hypothetical protein LZ554_005564 [Drepanopeziza brunnea f. sp. 'monogermtubi']
MSTSSPIVYLVTGCSSGFGTLFVHDILARGDKYTGAAILELDVTSPQEDIDAVVEKAIAVYGHVDVLINNAGYVHIGFCESTSKESYMEQLNTNFFGAVAVTTALLPHFRARRTGSIAFINSIYSTVTEIAASPYAVSKYALTAYALTLREEVAQFGIRVVSFDIGHFRTTLLDPGRTKADISKVIAVDDYKDMVRMMAEGNGEMNGKQPGNPELGIKRILDVLRGEGMAAGKLLPSRVPVGSDAVDLIREKCEENLRLVGEWEALARSTDFDEPKRGRWATKE